jgi:hypothetical protein
MSDEVWRILGIGAIALLVILAATGSPSTKSGPMMGGGGGSIPADNQSAVPSKPAVEQISVSDAEPDSAGLKKKDKEIVITVVSNFTANITGSESERRSTLIKAANKTCNIDQDVDKEITLKDVKRSGKESKKSTRRLAYSAEIANEWFTNEIPTAKFNDIRDGVGTATKYLPLIGSYNRMADAACDAAEYQNETAIQRFQWSAMMFGVDVALIQSNVFYKPAFRTTGLATNQSRKIGLWRLRRFCGNRCLGLGMSEVYTGLKTAMYGTTDKLIHDLGVMGIEQNQVDWQWLAQKQGWNGSQLPDSFPNKSQIDSAGDTINDRGKQGLRAVENATKKQLENIQNSTQDLGDKDIGKAACETKDTVKGWVEGLGGSDDDGKDNDCGQ